MFRAEAPYHFTADSPRNIAAALREYQNNLRINMCRCAYSLCRKVTSNAQTDTKGGKIRPLRLEIFKECPSRSGHTTRWNASLVKED